MRASLLLYLFIAGAVVGLMQLFSAPIRQRIRNVGRSQQPGENGNLRKSIFDCEYRLYSRQSPPIPSRFGLMIRLLILPHLIALVAAAGNIIANALIAAWPPRISLVFYGDVTLSGVSAMVGGRAAYAGLGYELYVAGLILFCLFSAWSIENRAMPYDSEQRPVWPVVCANSVDHGIPALDCVLNCAPKNSLKERQPCTAAFCSPVCLSLSRRGP